MKKKMMVSEVAQGQYREQLGTVSRWVVKIGSAMLTNDGKGLDQALLNDWAGQMAALQQAGRQVLLVSSGAVAVGRQQLGWRQRPRQLSELQTAAAVGQMRLSHAWQEAFAAYGIDVAQVLLTHDDAADRKRYLNIRSTLQTMCQLGIVPVINENDTVSYDEIRFGDNDNLGAMVANVAVAGGYIILTDQQGLYDKHPEKNDDAQLISAAFADDHDLLAMAGKVGGEFGSGGMYTKVLAAQKAARSGTHTLLAFGREQGVISRLSAGESLGTMFVAANSPQQARKQWLGSQLQVSGRLHLDSGATQALVEAHKSLLAVGVTAVEGEFPRGALLSCCDPQGKEIARGLSNYNSQDVALIAGKPSSVSAQYLVHGDALIHRDNMVVL